ncbi:enoyl-CoA hydratase/isomerase family protein [Microbacterium sp. No. 7]|uniref:enoyl-CoA hydratase/isomerase family protein n=1 Tax=Microbacterium sp. No. 7 TaxID=1714373 RepID=UPI0006CFB466|nr:enoyl-CoA hydratase/isomerase family protein [Microbacterium sp. No. 7]ALJ21854.1 enoyl-CoA hydratase [Microbacterium sp. No. 7]
MTYTEIKASVDQGVGTIAFDRYDRRNALSMELFQDLGDCLTAWKKDDDVAVVVITGGEDIFCAGLDLQLQSAFTQETMDAYAEICLWVYGLILDYPKPTIAAVGGPAFGGGCDIAVFCDIRIGGDNVRMGYPQVKMGLTPYFTPLWKIIGLSQAKLLTLSGELIDAREIERIGMVDRLVPAGTVVAEATRLARAIAETTTRSAANNKEMMLRAPAMDPISALTYETLAYREVIRQPDVIRRVNEGYAKLRK